MAEVEAEVDRRRRSTIASREAEGTAESSPSILEAPACEGLAGPLGALARAAAAQMERSFPWTLARGRRTAAAAAVAAAAPPSSIPSERAAAVAGLPSATRAAAQSPHLRER